ncbi:MAG: class I SAM-dependent methyltransferase [Candidatus Magnetobacterium sp. LHC-1]|uniref:Class I SAM-dependent methyltransferase n=1 Tax=Candidatus Magnetobacterium casense TaxID=1455061 RepID=A0ABS6S0L9_9BACT|nr:class I SAM-dependent methyltransferase [Candidatus Magnetobacterium casensis]MBF0609315.1 class I SAM-dependent methyltransferase [Nitrospirota bacterium]MBV6342366.1 class I SAM-dependent methyltransferase [Candidatus Magnetobacterium casensis]
MLSKDLNNMIAVTKQWMRQRHPGAYEALKMQYHNMRKRMAPPKEQPHTVLKREQYPEVEFIAEMSKLPAPRILEIGSRKVVGSMPRQLISSKAEFVGLDIMEGQGVDVVGDAHRLSELFEPDSFDGVYSAAVFEHIAMPWKVALEINRVLRRGGFAYIGSHHTYPMHEMPWDFWRYGNDAFSTIFGVFNGFEVENEGLVWPASLCHHDTESVVENGYRCYLFTHVLARKTHDYNPADYKWDIDCMDILPKWHFYPEKTGVTVLDEGAEIKRGYRALEKPVGCVDTLFDGFIKSVKQQQQRPLVAFLTTPAGDKALSGNNRSGLSLEVLQYSNVKSARAIYGLSKRMKAGRFDAVILWDVLGLLEYPWVAAISIAHIIRQGGRLFVLDRNTKPLGRQQDLWRFSSEALRVLFNPAVGLEVEDALIADPATLYPKNMADPIFKYYNKDDACYFTSACVATRVEATAQERLTWNVK